MIESIERPSADNLLAQFGDVGGDGDCQFRVIAAASLQTAAKHVEVAFQVFDKTELTRIVDVCAETQRDLDALEDELALLAIDDELVKKLSPQVSQLRGDVANLSLLKVCLVISSRLPVRCAHLQC